MSVPFKYKSSSKGLHSLCFTEASIDFPTESDTCFRGISVTSFPLYLIASLTLLPVASRKQIKPSEWKKSATDVQWAVQRKIKFYCEFMAEDVASLPFTNSTIKSYLKITLITTNFTVLLGIKWAVLLFTLSINYFLKSTNGEISNILSTFKKAFAYWIN